MGSFVQIRLTLRAISGIIRLSAARKLEHTHVVKIGIQVLSVTEQHVLRAADLSRQHGLLSGDALIVAVMQAHNLTSFASNDTDFDRVPSVTRYGPL
ncbi:MAG: type II toxin-antitoxin system VapC family toxin [Planctomycetota bacterium]|nr:type II toxin-antitoxin system VapC family toxin [Planctomycetota bacterium]